MKPTDKLRLDYARLYPAAFAGELAQGEAAEIASVLSGLAADVAARVAARLPAALIGELTEPQHVQVISALLQDAPLNDAIALLAKIPRQRTLTLVNALRTKRRTRLLQYLNYPPYSVGASLSHAPVIVPVDTSIRDLVAMLKTADGDGQPEVIAVTASGEYAGVVNPWRVLTQAEQTLGHALVQPQPLLASMTVTSAMRDVQFHLYNWLPVVDHANRVVGSFTRQQEQVPRATSDEGFSGVFAEFVRAMGTSMEVLLTTRRGQE